MTFYNGLSMTPGDCGSWSQLFFDNLSTLLGALFAMQGLLAFGVTKDTMDNIVFGRVVPGVGMTLFFGNIYYSWMAIRLTNKYGRQYTAQPYGLNTPAAFAFVYNIIYAVFFEQIANPAVNPDDAFTLGYKVALSANFLTGVILFVLGLFGRLILKVVPPAALLVPIAGIGISFLGLEQLSFSVGAPLVGYPAILWVFLGPYSSYPLPALPPTLILTFFVVVHRVVCWGQDWLRYGNFKSLVGQSDSLLIRNVSHHYFSICSRQVQDP